MAAGNGVWGIDIGQCGLKALRGELSADGRKVVATSFDYIEYPKILSQPDAQPDQLVRDALKEFLSRNSVRGDKVGISISGQSGLARFIKLPPVDAKKIPDIVKYEAKQQIPFALDDVIWDYQEMPSRGSDEDVLERMVGLFAMKRDQVFRTIQPLVDAEVELDIIQLTPICIYNAIAFDQLIDHAPADEDEEAESIVILSLGTEASDLVVTNGFSVWQRSIPLGGNHFTKQLTKELKLTFAKAEHAKRTARDSKDAKKIIQCMRPVYNTLVTEVQRSIGYFRSLERGTDLSKVLVLGNATKLPGLTQYLAKNLELDVVRLDAFSKLTGAEVTDAAAFKENLLAYPVSYGLVLQGLRKANLATNLVPREILRQRLIRRKKPWAAAIAAAVLLGCAFNFFFHWRGWNSVHADYEQNGVTWADSIDRVKSAKSQSSRFQSEDETQSMTLLRLYELGDAVVGSADGRLLWLEMLKTVTEALPVDPENNSPDDIRSVEELPLDNRRELYIESIKCQYFPEVSTWVSSIQDKYEEEMQALLAAREGNGEAAAGGSGEDADARNAAGANAPAIEKPQLEGGGWVIELHGVHFHNDDVTNRAANYVRNELIKKLEWGEVELPTGPGKPTMKFTNKELGIHYPVIIRDWRDPNYTVVVPGNDKPGAGTPGGGSAGRPLPRAIAGGPPDTGPKTYSGNAHRFVVQFVWQQIPLKKRLELREEQAASASVADRATDGTKGR